MQAVGEAAQLGHRRGQPRLGVGDGGAHLLVGPADELGPRQGCLGSEEVLLRAVVQVALTPSLVDRLVVAVAIALLAVGLVALVVIGAAVRPVADQRPEPQAQVAPLPPTVR